MKHFKYWMTIWNVKKGQQQIHYWSHLFSLLLFSYACSPKNTTWQWVKHPFKTSCGTALTTAIQNTFNTVTITSTGPSMKSVKILCWTGLAHHFIAIWKKFLLYSGIIGNSFTKMLKLNNLTSCWLNLMSKLCSKTRRIAWEQSR